MNFTTTHIRSEKVTVDTRIYTVLEGGKKSGKVYLAAAQLQPGAGSQVCGQTVFDWCGHSAPRKHGRQLHLSYHRRNLSFPEVSGKSQRHPDGGQPEVDLHLHRLRCVHERI